MPMRSKFGNYKSVEKFVVNYLLNKDGIFTYEQLEKAINKEFPQSKFNKKHLSHYRHIIEDGIYGRVSKHVIENIYESIRSPRTERSKKGRRGQDELQIAGHKLLKGINTQIERISQGDDAKMFYLKRFLYQRLRSKEVKDKNIIRDQIWKNGVRECNRCGKEYSKPTGLLAVHRKDSNKPYSLSNCVLMCIECHRKEHSKKP